MSRDRALIEECLALQAALRPHASLDGIAALGRLAAARTPARCGVVRAASHARRTSPANAARAEPAAPAAPGHDRVRAVHWNIEHGNRFAQIEGALERHAQLAGADLVLLNEVDLGMARSGNRDVAAELGAALGMHAAFAPLFLETTPGRDEDPALARGSRQSGSAVRTRDPVAASIRRGARRAASEPDRDPVRSRTHVGPSRRAGGRNRAPGRALHGGFRAP